MKRLRRSCANCTRRNNTKLTLCPICRQAADEATSRYMKTRKFKRTRRQYLATERAWLTAALSRAHRRAKKRGLKFSVSLNDLRLPKRCPVLGILLTRGTGSTSDSSPSLDRIIPKRGYVKGNVVIISEKS